MDEGNQTILPNSSTHTTQYTMALHPAPALVQDDAEYRLHVCRIVCRAGAIDSYIQYIITSFSSELIDAAAERFWMAFTVTAHHRAASTAYLRRALPRAPIDRTVISPTFFGVHDRVDFLVEVLYRTADRVIIRQVIDYFAARPYCRDARCFAIGHIFSWASFPCSYYALMQSFHFANIRFITSAYNTDLKAKTDVQVGMPLLKEALELHKLIFMHFFSEWEVHITPFLHAVPNHEALYEHKEPSNNDPEA